MKSIFFNNSRFFYCSETNTIINSEFKDIYENFTQKRKVKIEDIELNETIIQSKVKNLNHVIFETTQECNLECKYCVYASQKYLYHRTPTSKSLNVETARKALDYIKKIISGRSRREFTIGFYGGEPLLNYQMIKIIVKYAKNIFENWKLNFSMTTNGTLLTEEIIRFLIDNSFILRISLDGPIENHDAKRVFPTGKGSFQQVIKNMNKIKKINEEYFKKIFLAVVISKDLPLEKTVDFFKNNELVKHLPMRISFVNEKDNDYYKYFPYNQQTFIQSRKNFYDSVIEKKRNKIELLPIESSFIDQIKRLTSYNVKKRIFFTTAATCFFDNRLFVDVNGRFHVCERVNQSFSIGDTESGFNYPRMTKMLKEFSQLIKTNCLDCEANYLCERCFVHFARDGRFELNHELCRRVKSQMKNMLENILQLQNIGIGIN
jgi:uncharacterized protein